MTEEEQVNKDHDVLPKDEDGDDIVATLVIRLTADGRTKVRGPIHNKNICYALLLGGADAIQEAHLKQAGLLVDPEAKKKPSGLVLPFRRPGPHTNGLPT